MSDTSTTTNEDLPGLRDAARRGKAAEERAASLERQLLFAHAGINIEDDGIGEMLFQTFQGDTVDALKERATKVGYFATTTQPTTTTTPPSTEAPANTNAATAAENAARIAAYAAMADGEPSGAREDLGPDPTDEALRSFQQDVVHGTQREDAGVHAIQKVIGAAMRGDKRVLWNQAKHDAAVEEARARRGF